MADDQHGKVASGSAKSQSTSRKSFFWWLQSIRDALLAGNSQRLGELQRALAEKHAAVLLTTIEVDIRNSLEVYLLARGSASSLVHDVSSIKALLDLHRAHTFDASSSSQNHRAFVAYASLLVKLHDLYHVSVEGESIRATPSMDPLVQWSDIEGGPLLSHDGAYLTLAGMKIASKEQALAAGVVEQWDAILSSQAVSESLKELDGRLQGDIEHSQMLWRVRQRFEVNRTANVDSLQRFYEDRLAQPHVQVDETAQIFSSFITSSRPAEEYEGIMARAYGIIVKGKEITAACERFEDATKAVEASGLSSITKRWEVWKPYTRWAASTALTSTAKAKTPKAPVGAHLAACIFERALMHCGATPSCAEEEPSFGKAPPLTKKELSAMRGTEGRDERNTRLAQENATLSAEEAASAELWASYLRFLSTADLPLEHTLDVCERARKVQGHNGTVQGAGLRAMCRKKADQQHIDAFFSAALANEELRQSGTQVGALLLARIDVAREEAANRLVQSDESSTLQEAIASLPKREDIFMDIFGLMSFALDNLKSAATADESLRLEQVTSDWCLTGGEACAMLAEPVWEAALARQPDNGLAWLRAASYELATGNLKQAAHTVRRALGRHKIHSARRVELAELLLRISHLGGSIQDIEHALKSQEDEQQRIWSDYYSSYAQASTMSSAVNGVEASQDTDMTDGAGIEAGKRKTEQHGADVERPHLATDTAEKRIRKGDAKPARDREFSSVMIDQLPSDATEHDVISLFSDCGEILEISGPKAFPPQGQGDVEEASASAALVEFVSRESIPAARSKQLKVFRGSQIQVRLGYECTLYVTNFPVSYDSDQAIRDLFTPYGRLFDVRWPSKKYLSTRRFCYVVFCNADEARQALTLHNTELGDGTEAGKAKLQVLMSDPHRKKLRSDAFNDEKELFVSGLSRSVNEDTLRDLFAPGVENVRIPKHPDGRNRGIAYVDMSTTLDAQRVLGRTSEFEGGGYRVNGKLLTVNLVDRKKQAEGSHTSGRLDERLDIERRNRCLYIRGLPSDAQEPLIQQLIEREFGLGTVKRIEWTAGAESQGQAILEFSDAAHAGRASLSDADLTYGDHYPVRFAPLETRGAAAAAFVPRQAGSARRGGRGRGAPAFKGRSGQVTSVNNGMEVDESLPSKDTGIEGKGQDSFRQMLSKG